MSDSRSEPCEWVQVQAPAQTQPNLDTLAGSSSLTHEFLRKAIVMWLILLSFSMLYVNDHACMRADGVHSSRVLVEINQELLRGDLRVARNQVAMDGSTANTCRAGVHYSEGEATASSALTDVTSCSKPSDSA